MMTEGKRKSVTFYLAATAAVLICYLAQVTDCNRLTKTERRKEVDKGKTKGPQDGRIVFGKAFEKGSEVADGTKKSSNASVEDESTYQADSWGWSKGQTTNAGAAEALWRHMNPSLQCGGDQMRFRAMGPGSSLFAVEQPRAPAIPLSQIPATCGYNMQRNSLGFAMHAPYDGCNMVQEGGNYVLPMRWQGIPVSLWCPKPAAQPTAAAPTTAEKHPEMPKFPQYPVYPPFYPVTPAPATTLAPTTTPKPTFPPYPMYPPFYPPFYPPVTPAPATTLAPTTTPKPTLPPYPFFPPFFPPFYPPVTPAPATTLAPTTTPKPTLPPYPFFPPFYPPFYPPPVPTTTAAPTTTTAAPTTKTPMPAFPFPWPFPGPLPADPRFPPYVFPPFPFNPYTQPPATAPPTTAPPTTTATPTTATTKKQPDHTHPHAHFPFPYPYPFPPYANVG